MGLEKYRKKHQEAIREGKRDELDYVNVAVIAHEERMAGRREVFPGSYVPRYIRKEGKKDEMETT